MKRALFGIGLLIIFSACGEIKKVDRSGMEKQQADREVKVVKDADIIMMAQKLGEELSTKDFPNPESQKYFVDSLAVKGILVKYLVLSDTISSTLSPEELSLLQAYSYNLEQNLSLVPNLQIINKEKYLYTFPKIKNDSLFAIVSIFFPKREIVIKL